MRAHVREGKGRSIILFKGLNLRVIGVHDSPQLNINEKSTTFKANSSYVIVITSMGLLPHHGFTCNIIAPPQHEHQICIWQLHINFGTALQKKNMQAEEIRDFKNALV